MRGMLDGLVCRLRRKIQNRSHAGGHGRAEVRNVVNLEAAERYASREVDLDFIARHNAANEIQPRPAALLCHRENRRDVIARMTSVEIEEVVVVIQLPDSGTIGPGCPFAMHCLGWGMPNDPSSSWARVSERLCACAHDRITVESRDGRSGGVNEAVFHDFDDLGRDRDRVAGDFSDAPGKLGLPVESLARCSHPYLVGSHSFSPSTCAAQIDPS